MQNKQILYMIYHSSRQYKYQHIKDETIPKRNDYEYFLSTIWINIWLITSYVKKLYVKIISNANIKMYHFRLKAKSLPLTDAFNFQKRISRGLRKGQPLQHKNSQRLLTLPTNLNGMMTFYGFSCSFKYSFAIFLLLYFIFRWMANNFIVCCQK